MLDATVGLIDTQQNKVIYLLSIMGIVMTPPVLVASIYGMNFHDMPESVVDLRLRLGAWPDAAVGRRSHSGVQAARLALAGALPTSPDDRLQFPQGLAPAHRIDAVTPPDQPHQRVFHQLLETRLPGLPAVPAIRYRSSMPRPVLPSVSIHPAAPSLHLGPDLRCLRARLPGAIT